METGVGQLKVKGLFSFTALLFAQFFFQSISDPIFISELGLTLLISWKRVTSAQASTSLALMQPSMLLKTLLPVTEQSFFQPLRALIPRRSSFSSMLRANAP